MFESGDAGNRADAPDLVMLITDGTPTVLKENTVPEANKLKQLGASVSLFQIGLFQNLVSTSQNSVNHQ